MSWSVALVLSLLEVVERQGVPSATRDEAVGTARRTLRDPHGRLDDAGFTRLVERLHGLYGDRLGLDAGLVPGTTLTPLGHAALCAPSLRHALEAFCRYEVLLRASPGSRLDVDGPRARVTLGAFADTLASQVARDQMLGWLLRFAQGFGDPQSATPIVSLGGTPRASLDDYRVQFGVELEHAPETRITFASSWLTRPSRLPDPLLFETLCRHSDAALGFVRKDALAREVQSAIQRTLGDRAPEMNQVADVLGLPVAELRRQLREGGHSFRQLLDEARRARAEQLLLDAGVSVKDAAYTLGFSDPSAFNRAVRRWTGYTPLAFRRLRQDLRA